MSENFCAPKFEERTLEETSRQEEYAPQSSMEFGEKYVSSRPRTKHRRTYVCGGFGASMHLLSKRDSRSDVMNTFADVQNPTTVVTTDGEVQTKEEAQVYVHDLDLFVTEKLFGDLLSRLQIQIEADSGASRIHFRCDYRKVFWTSRTVT